MFSSPRNLFLLYIFFKCKERPAKTNFILAKLRALLVKAYCTVVLLRVMLVNFEFSKNVILCYCVSQCRVTDKFLNKKFKKTTHGLQFLGDTQIFSSDKKQTLTRSLTPHTLLASTEFSRIFLVDSEMFYTLRVVDILFYLDL